MKLPSRRDAILALVLFGLALSLRLPDLDVFLTPDETRWACRTANFWGALSEGRFADTYQKEHPGVITMWLGGLGLPIDTQADWAIACRDIPSSELVEMAPRPALDAIRDRLFAGRARVAIFVSLGVGAIFLLSIGLLGLRAALLGGVLLAMEPFYAALGRVLHLDAVTATLMTLALLALLRARSGTQSRSGNVALFVAGTVAGFAALNKSPGLFLGPMAGLIFLVDAWLAHRRRARGGVASPQDERSVAETESTVAAARAQGDQASERTSGTISETASDSVTDQPDQPDWRLPGDTRIGRPPSPPGPSRPSTQPARPWLGLIVDTFRPLLIWGAGAVVMYFVLWPSMWVAPIKSLSGVLLGATDYATQGHEGHNYFLGQPTLDPGPFFYPVAWFVRATPIGLIGLALAAWRVLRGVRDDESDAPLDRETAAWLVAFAVLFGVFMTLGAKKFDRYLLPSVPALLLVAGWGWAGAVTWIGRTWRKRRGAPSCGCEDGLDSGRAAGAMVLALLVFVLPHRPYLFTYFNPLSGGQTAAPRTLLVGWGEGIDGAARWLNERPDPETLEVATRYRSAFGPLFRGRALEMNKIDPATVDYYLFYMNQIQRNLDPELMTRYFPGVDWMTDFDDLWRGDAITEGAANPVHVVRLGEIDYAWLFENDSWRDASAFIEERADPARDAILARADSRFARMYDGPLPLIPLDPDASEAEVVETLREAFGGHPAVWLVRYDEIAPRPALARLDYEIGTRSFTTSRVDLPELRVTRHQGEARTITGVPDFGVPPELLPVLGSVSFGGALELTRVGRTDDQLYWGRDLGLTLEWSAERDLDANYTAFIHLIGPDGRRWAHEDLMIGDRDLVPTERWDPSEPKLDQRTIHIPAGTPPGSYRLLLGVYDGATGERLPVTVDGGEPQPDDVYTMPIMVGRSLAEPDVEALRLDHVVGETVGAWTKGVVIPEKTGARLTDDVAFVGYDASGGLYGGRSTELGVVWRILRDGEDTLPRTVEPGTDSPDASAVSARIRILDSHDQEIAGAVFDLVPGMPVADRWGGDVLRTWYPLEIDERVQAGEGTLIIDLLDEDGGDVILTVGADMGEHMTHVAPITIAGPVRTFDLPDAEALGNLIDYRFGDVAHLRGATITAEAVIAGLDGRPIDKADDESSGGDGAERAVMPILWWEALGEPEIGYTRFMHLVDGAGVIRGQLDGPPMSSEGDRPTTSWLKREYVKDAPTLTLGAEALPGRYRLAVGLYDPATGERLPVIDPSGERVPDDRVVVGEVLVR